MAITFWPPEELNLMLDSWTLFTISSSVRGRRGRKPLAPIRIILEPLLYQMFLSVLYFTSLELAKFRKLTSTFLFLSTVLNTIFEDGTKAFSRSLCVVCV